MRRSGRLELILELPDGSRSLISAAWTSLEAPSGPAPAGTLGSLDDLLAAARVLTPLVERVVLAGGDDLRPESEDAAGSGSVAGPGARGGAVGAAGRGAPASGDDAPCPLDPRPDAARTAATNRTEASNGPHTLSPAHLGCALRRRGGRSRREPARRVVRPPHTEGSGGRGLTPRPARLQRPLNVLLSAGHRRARQRPP